MEDQELVELIRTEINPNPNPESEILKISEEKQVVSLPSSCCSSNPICVFSRQSNHKAESEDRFKSGKKLCGLILFCLTFILIEIIGGIKANSLAVLADAAHLLTDVVGFTVSLYTVWASGWEPTKNHSFGFFRFEVLGALFSVQLIWLISGVLIYEAVNRILVKETIVNGKLMFITAVFGVLINLMMVKWLGHDHIHHGCNSEEDHNHENEDSDKVNLVSGSSNEHHCEIENPRNHHHHHHHDQSVQSSKSLDWIILPMKELRQKHVNMNLQGAYLHILGDLIQSIGVMIGGAIIWAKPEWLIVDLICTLCFTVLVLFTTISMLRNLLSILTESSPKGINVVELEAGIRSIHGVVDVHDLHVWSISVGKILMSCHLIAEKDFNLKEILHSTRVYCERSYGIHHVTVQIEQ